MTVPSHQRGVERISTEGPSELDQGYFEFRVNWTAATLLAMSGVELDEFKAALAALERLAFPLEGGDA